MIFETVTTSIILWHCLSTRFTNALSTIYW